MGLSPAVSSFHTSSETPQTDSQHLEWKWPHRWVGLVLHRRTEQLKSSLIEIQLTLASIGQWTFQYSLYLTSHHNKIWNLKQLFNFLNDCLWLVNCPVCFSVNLLTHVGKTLLNCVHVCENKKLSGFLKDFQLSYSLLWNLCMEHFIKQSSHWFFFISFSNSLILGWSPLWDMRHHELSSRLVQQTLK